MDVLYWVGCTEALEDRSLKVAQATAKLLKWPESNSEYWAMKRAAAVILPAVLGNEYLYQMQAIKNIEVFKELQN